jgi:hypothetical protein
MNHEPCVHVLGSAEGVPIFLCMEKPTVSY